MLIQCKELSAINWSSSCIVSIVATCNCCFFRESRAAQWASTSFKNGYCSRSCCAFVLLLLCTKSLNWEIFWSFWMICIVRACFGMPSTTLSFAQLKKISWRVPRWIPLLKASAWSRTSGETTLESTATCCSGCGVECFIDEIEHADAFCKKNTLARRTFLKLALKTRVKRCFRLHKSCSAFLEMSFQHEFWKSTLALNTSCFVIQILNKIE